MKKFLLTAFLVIGLVCALALSVSAADYYLVQDDTSDLATNLKDEGKTVISVASLYGSDGFFATLADGDNAVIKLAENISYNPGGTISNQLGNGQTNALRINAAATVTVEFSGYYWWFTSTASGYTGFMLDNTNATLRLIGTKAKNADGTFKNLGAAPSYRTTTPEEERDIDLYNEYVMIYIGKGNLYLQDLASASKEEYIYHKDGLRGDGSITIKDCSIGAWYGSYGVLGLTATKPHFTIDIDGGIYDYAGIETIRANSSVKNARFTQSTSFILDGYTDRNSRTFTFENVVFEGEFKLDGDSSIVEATNCTFNKISLVGDSSGGPTVNLYDSTYQTLSMGNKNSTVFTVYTTPTCDAAGTKTVYTVANSSGTADEAYALENPAKGHTIGEAIDVEYKNYFEGGYKVGTCSACTMEGVMEKNPSIGALIINLGYSYNEENGVASVSQTFKLQSEMIKYLASDFEFGLIASVNPTGAQLTPYAEDSAIYAKIPDTYQRSTIKFSGIPTATNLDTMLVFCAVVIENGEVHYLDNGTTSISVVGQSCNTVKAMTGYDQE